MKPRMLPLLVVVVSLTIPSWAAERHRVQLLVPDDKLAEARVLTSPLPNTPEIAAQGKAIYDGKGACFRCHGKDGDGNGPLAAQLNLSPRKVLSPSDRVTRLVIVYSDPFRSSFTERFWRSPRW